MGDLDLSIENIYYALSFVNTSKERLNELSSVVNAINLSGVELSTAGLLNDVKSTINGILNGTFTDVGNRLENTKKIIVDNDINASLLFSFLAGDFNDENGNYDEEKAQEFIDKKVVEMQQEAEKRAQEEYYEKLKNDPNYRYETALNAILNESGFSSLDELDSQRDKLLSTIKELNRRKNDILFSDAQVTLNFLNVVNGKYMGICTSFDAIANSEIIAYKYIDNNGMESYSWTLNGIPKDYRNKVESLSYSDMCKGSELYNEVKKGFDDSWFFSSPFNKDFNKLSNKIQQQINDNNKELEKLNNLLNDNREQLSSLNSTRQNIVDSAKYISDDVWKYTLNDDFNDNKINVKGDEISLLLNDFKNNNIVSSVYSDSMPFLNKNFVYLFEQEEEMNVIYSLISGSGEFFAGGGDVSYADKNGRIVYLKSNDDMLSNMSLWSSSMSEEQKEIFYYNWNTGGYTAAYEYLENISDELNNAYIYNQTKKDQQFATDNPGLASFTSVMLGPGEGLKALEYSVKQLLNKDKVYSSQLYSVGDTMRAQVSTDIANSGKKYAAANAFMYNVYMSIADNVYSIALTGGNPVASGMVLGSGGFDNNMNDALSRGLSDSEAFWYSGSMACVEAATEAVSIDNLLNLKIIKNADDVIKAAGKVLDVSDDAINTTLKTTNNVIDNLSKINNWNDELFSKLVLNLDDIIDPKYRNLVYKGTNLLYGATKQGSGEGMEELASSIMGEWVDKLIAGDDSSFNLSVENYINNGYTEAEAIALTQQQQIEEFAMSYLSGLTSGTMSGGGKLSGSMVIEDVKSYVSNIMDKHKNPDYDVFATSISDNISRRNFEGAIDVILNQDGKSLGEKTLYASSLISLLSNEDSRMISENMQAKLSNMVQEYVDTHNDLEIEEIVVDESFLLEKSDNIFEDPIAIVTGLKDGTITKGHVHQLFNEIVGDNLSGWVLTDDAATSLYVNLLGAAQNAGIPLSDVQGCIDILDSMVKYYEDAKVGLKDKLTSGKGFFNTYRTHGVVHIMDVLTQSINSYAAFNNAGIENLSLKTIMLSAVMHDTGMSGGQQIHLAIENGTERLIITTDNVDSTGKAYRESHSFNSAVNILNEFEILRTAGYTDLQIAEAALLTFAHSKSNSGLNPLSGNVSGWSFAIQALSKATDGIEFNIIDVLIENGKLSSSNFTGYSEVKIKTPTGKVKGNIGNFDIDTKWLSTLGYEGLIIRLGDALTNNDNGITNQYGGKITFDKTNYNFQKSIAESFAKAGIDSTLSFEEQFRILMTTEDLLSEAAGAEAVDLVYEIGGKEEKSSQQFVLGENNQTYSIKNSSDGDVEVIVSLKHSDVAPLCTLFAIVERSGELNSKGSGMFGEVDSKNIKMVIEIDSTTSDSVRNLYEQYVEFARENGLVPVEIREVSNLAQITDPSVIEAGLKNGTISKGQIHKLNFLNSAI